MSSANLLSGTDWIDAIKAAAEALAAQGITPLLPAARLAAMEGAKKPDSTVGHSKPTAAPSEEWVIEALARIQNGDAGQFDREWQLRVAHAVRGAVMGTAFDSPAVRQAFIDWSDLYPAADHAHDGNLYDGIRRTHSGFVQLIELAEFADPDWAQRARNALARAAFGGAPIEQGQAAMIAAMPPVAHPGIPAWAADLNARLAYIAALDRVVEIDPVTGVFGLRLTPPALCRYYDGMEKLTDAKGKSTGVGTAWMHSEYARRYKDFGMWDVGQEPPGHYNIWRGLSASSSWPRVEPESPIADSLDVILSFIKYVIASGRDDVYRHMLDWTAHKVQNPLEPSATATALVGKQGTGKSTMAEMLIDIVGPHHSITASSERQMLGNFNAHFENKLVGIFEEAFLGRDPRYAGPFKDLVTGGRLHIEAKGIDVRDVPNRLAILLTSNEVSVVPLEPNDRRTTLIVVSDSHRQDSAYFKQLRAAWTNGGREAFIEFLKARDLSAYDPRRPLHTPEKTEALGQSGDPIIRFWADFLAGGTPVQSHKPVPDDWAAGPVFMSNNDLHNEFRHFADQARIGNHRPSRPEFFRRLSDLCPISGERPRVNGPGQSGSRGHTFPKLDECLAAFDLAAGGVSSP